MLIGSTILSQYLLSVRTIRNIFSFDYLETERVRRLRANREAIISSHLYNMRYACNARKGKLAGSLHVRSVPRHREVQTKGTHVMQALGFTGIVRSKQFARIMFPCGEMAIFPLSSAMRIE